MDTENDKEHDESDESDFWDGFWDGYEDFLRQQNVKRGMTDILSDNILLDNIISQGIPKDRITIMVGKPNQNYMENYTDIFISKRINELRSENLKKILDD